MNQTMTENPANQTESLPIVNTERSENDVVMDTLRPYLTQVGVLVAIGLLGLIAITLFINNRQQSVAEPWQELTSAQSEFAISGNVDRLTQVAATHPDTPAAMWALQSAGDYQLRRGIDQLREDRTAGFELIEKSKDSFQKILDAPASAKSSDVQQASVFSMAYASESLGEFDEAARYYTQLIEEAPDSHFADAAKRGAARSTNPEFVAAYKKFKEFEDIGDAPGPNVPDRPDIEFPEFEIPQKATGDDEKSDDAKETAGDNAQMEQPAVKPAAGESEDVIGSAPETTDAAVSDVKDTVAKEAPAADKAGE
jgi:tetratricopeptide (TPR) repeat protein